MELKYEEIVIKPIVTERSMHNQAFGKYTFEVHPKSNKIQIRKAIEKLFKVGVVSVNTIKIPGKTRRYRTAIGKTRDRKKAIVTLKQGDKIVIKGIEMFEE
ncbi:MAG: 50S ribosomal protein L23 [Firmicutes bacterium]|nr:50S ribosomal protein L23 [Bacillota bacterium]